MSRMSEDPYGATIPVWLVRGLLHDQLNALTVLGSRLAVIRDGLMNSRVTTDEVKQAEETATWLERLTLETLRDLGPGKRERPTARCDIVAVVEASIRRWAGGMPSVEVEADVEEGLWAAVPPTALERILQNLLMNAGEFADSRVLVRSRRADDSVEVVVEDDGPGFSGDAFPPLGSSGRSGGLGLGLSVVRWVTEYWGGSAHLRSPSELGGARVVVCLPAGETPPPRSADLGLAGSLDGARVTLVDDSPEVLRAMGALLERAGARVLRVFADPTSTPAALADRVGAAEPAEVTLIDVHLGTISGFEVVDELRKRGADPANLILMSGTGPEQDRPGGIEQIGKPPDWDLLIRMIRERTAS